jgi:quaternary ammonium compound-resistance protein SugE
MPWLHLIIAGLLEVAWAIGLKQTEGWTRLWPSVTTALLMMASFFFLSLALRSLPLGTAYAIWTGIGAVGTALIGIIVFDEPRTAARLVCIVLIVAGIVGLKLTSGSQA